MVLDTTSVLAIKQEQKRNGSRCIYSGGYESSSEIKGNWEKLAEAFEKSVLHA